MLEASGISVTPPERPKTIADNSPTFPLIPQSTRLRRTDMVASTTHVIKESKDDDSETPGSDNTDSIASDNDDNGENDEGDNGMATDDNDEEDDNEDDEDNNNDAEGAGDDNEGNRATMPTTMPPTTFAVSFFSLHSKLKFY